jgi:polyhydroxybutyrate depolymerase
VPGPGDFTRVLAFDGRTRTYLLHVPPDIGSNASPPLILVFHGVPSGPQEIRSITGFDALADRKGFVNSATSWDRTATTWSPAR